MEQQHRKRRSKVHFYAHLVWATRGRTPLLTPADIERRVHRCIHYEAERLKCTVLAIQGMPDHVHLVVQMPSTLAVSRLAQAVKGVSSRFANETLGFDGAFDWQQNYAAFSLSRSHLTRVVKYVQNQKEHHQEGTQWSEWEEADEAVAE
ncbi:MAG TPA: IS200/IS605 family transposase [Abditibacteriaceae bacterium]|jgi:REP element-mobilizing transposase RayT